MEAKQYVAKQPMDHWRSQRGNQKIPRDEWKWKYNDPKPMVWSKSSTNRRVYSDTNLPQEIRKISIKTYNFLPKRTRIKEQTKSKTSRRKEITKARAEINKIWTKKR